tara:strand:- start:160 stop:327 length:168 start_codon:yes stop_codon:yes gene_type:complete
MEPVKYITAGFLLGLGITYFMQASYEPPPQVNYIDQEMHADQELERAILVELPQE